MKAWPTVAGILLVICEQLKTVQPRDFSMKDIILLHPSTTPHPGGFKCFTCEDAADNYQCNRWAPDVFCPKGTKYCYTLHKMDDRGGSVSVTKRCATLENCQLTGCVNVTHSSYYMCTSCCEGNICNIMVPRNDSGAVFSYSSPLVSSCGGLHPATLLYFIIVAWSCLYWTCLNLTTLESLPKPTSSQSQGHSTTGPPSQ